jgi:type IV pilus assembly protein PilO
MLRSFDFRAQMKDRRLLARVGLGILLAANLVAAVFVFYPLGGSAEDLAEEMRSKQRELEQQQQRLTRTRGIVSKVQQAKVEGDRFLDDCTLTRRTAYSTVVGELNKMALESGMKPKEASYSPPEPVPGSETLEQLTISANYEGSYPSLTKFVNLIDKSPRFLIIDSMQASPQSTGALNITIKLDTFIRNPVGGKS